MEEKGYREWESLEVCLSKVAHQVKQLQEDGKKGMIQYVVFSYMSVSLPLNKIEIKIDLMDEDFYLDVQECTEYYSSEILQKRYIEDVRYLYREAEKRFIRIQFHELQEMEIPWRCLRRRPAILEERCTGSCIRSMKS